MSIINDALKKACKGHETGSPDRPDKNQHLPSGRKKTEIPVFTAALFLSLGIVVVYFLFFVPSESDIPAKIDHSERKTAPLLSSKKETSSDKKPVLRTGAPQTNLNGIVYEPEDKWAVINDEIIREGDRVTGGRVVSIGKDFVEIEKENGENLTLRIR